MTTETKQPGRHMCFWCKGVPQSPECRLCAGRGCFPTGLASGLTAQALVMYELGKIQRREQAKVD